MKQVGMNFRKVGKYMNIGDTLYIHELEKEIKQLKENVSIYENNIDSIFEDERSFANSILNDIIETIKNIELRER